MTDRLLPHLVRAIAEHVRWLRRQGLTAPPELTDLLDLLAALSGPGRPTVGVPPAAVDDADVMLLTEEDVARCLTVSPRTVRRLLASGELPSVRIGRSRRVHVDDLDGYVNRLKGRTA